MVSCNIGVFGIEVRRDILGNHGMINMGHLMGMTERLDVSDGISRISQNNYVGYRYAVLIVVNYLPEKPLCGL